MIKFRPSDKILRLSKNAHIEFIRNEQSRFFYLREPLRFAIFSIIFVDKDNFLKNSKSISFKFL